MRRPDRKRLRGQMRMPLGNRQAESGHSRTTENRPLRQNQLQFGGELTLRFGHPPRELTPRCRIVVQLRRVRLNLFECCERNRTLVPEFEYRTTIDSRTGLPIGLRIPFTASRVSSSDTTLTPGTRTRTVRQPVMPRRCAGRRWNRPNSERRSSGAYPSRNSDAEQREDGEALLPLEIRHERLPLVELSRYAGREFVQVEVAPSTADRRP